MQQSSCLRRFYVVAGAIYYLAMNPLNDAYEASSSRDVVFDTVAACCSQFLDWLC